MKWFRKSPYLWIRDLHLYFGLFISPFVLLFAVSTLLFNHTWKPWDIRGEAEAHISTVSIEMPEGLEGVPLAKAIMRQVGVTGEIRNIRRRKGHLIIPVMKPGQITTLSINPKSGMAEVIQRSPGFWDALFYLHKSPGPHLAGIRGNWIFTRIWTFLVDSVVYLVLFISASGIYLWAVIKAERKVGLILMGAGCLSFFLIVSTLVL